jgi:hypothetical protein
MFFLEVHGRSHATLKSSRLHRDKRFEILARVYIGGPNWLLLSLVVVLQVLGSSSASSSSSSSSSTAAAAAAGPVVATVIALER